MNRYIIGFLAFIGLGILLTVLLIGGGSNNKVQQHATTKPKLLYDYANTSAEVKMVIDGPIVSPEKHNSVVVTVGQNSANFELIQGYDGNVISSKSYNNTENSYRNFLYAIYYAGFSDGVKSNVSSDIGLCASSDRYDFYLINGSRILKHYWTTNCGGDPRTFGGLLNTVISLFRKQIPDYNQLSQQANI